MWCLKRNMYGLMTEDQDSNRKYVDIFTNHPFDVSVVGTT